MNIDPNTKSEKARTAKMKRDMQAWHNRVRENTACPRCEVAAGEYCLDRHGRMLIANHARRAKLYLLSPSELAPPDPQSAARSSSVRRGLGEVRPKRKQGPTKTS